MFWIHSSQWENCQASVRPGFQPPQRGTNGCRAGLPQIYGTFTITVTPVADLLSVINTVHNNNGNIVRLPTEKDKRLSSQWKQVLKNTGLAKKKARTLSARVSYLKCSLSLKSHNGSIQGHVTNNQASPLKYPSGKLVEDRSYPPFCNGPLLLVLIPYLSTVQKTRQERQIH